MSTRPGMAAPANANPGTLDSIIQNPLANDQTAGGHDPTNTNAGPNDPRMRGDVMDDDLTA